MEFISAEKVVNQFKKR